MFKLGLKNEVQYKEINANIVKMKDKKILVICHITNSNCNGQVAKTKDTIFYLRNHGFEVDVLNYGKLNIFQKVFISKKKIKQHDKIIIMPGGKNALFFYARLIQKYKKQNAHYLVVGGWVLSLLSEKKYSRKIKLLKKFKGIYFQNKRVKDEFYKHGFTNVFDISNYSLRTRITEEELGNRLKNLCATNSFNFCYFARVERSKGVLLACDAIKKISKEFPDYHISFDIYGEVKDILLLKELNKISESHSFIKYRGVLTGDDVILKLSHYFCMLFPTFYKGEGTPHTIIESFMAGLPVIASNWAYNCEIVNDKKTGIIFNFENNGLYEAIKFVLHNKDLIITMSKNCYRESLRYSIDKSLGVLIKNL